MQKKAAGSEKKPAGFEIKHGGLWKKGGGLWKQTRRALWWNSAGFGNRGSADHHRKLTHHAMCVRGFTGSLPRHLALRVWFHRKLARYPALCVWFHRKLTRHPEQCPVRLRRYILSLQQPLVTIFILLRSILSISEAGSPKAYPSPGVRVWFHRKLARYPELCPVQLRCSAPSLQPNLSPHRIYFRAVSMSRNVLQTELLRTRANPDGASYKTFNHILGVIINYHYE